MPATEYQGSSAPFACKRYIYIFISILSIRRDHFHMETSSNHSHNHLEGRVNANSIHFRNKRLLEAFSCFQEEFRAIMFNNKVNMAKAPLDHPTMGEAFGDCVGWLDHNQRMLGEGQFRRAKKALTDLAIGMLDEKEFGSVLLHRNQLFGQNNTSKDHLF
ncbi:hypothetical protein MKX01_028114 [Papaver californicum]|nr:hypothetical protein MKX01_028114 [Papaver californicum]